VGPFDRLRPWTWTRGADVFGQQRPPWRKRASGRKLAAIVAADVVGYGGPNSVFFNTLG